MKSLENLSSEDLWSEILRQHQFRESHYKIVGHIVVQFSAMEMILSSLVAQIVNRDNFVPALMAFNRLSLVNIIDIARTTFRLQEQDADLQARLDSLLNRIDELRIKRNGIIHSFWEYDVDSLSFSYTQMLPDRKKKIRFKDTSYTIQQFKALESDVQSVNNELLKFVTAWQKRQQPNDSL